MSSPLGPFKLAYSIPEAVQASGLSRTTLYEHNSAGRLRMKKAGSRTIILADDLRAFLDALPDL